MQAKRAAAITAAFLALVSIISGSISPAWAWNPTEMQDLPGTDNSIDYDVSGANGRFDIYTAGGTNGLQVGEDGDSIAFLIKLANSSEPGTRFAIQNLATGDQYEVGFTIGNYTFAILFRAIIIRLFIITIRIGTCSLYYKLTSGGSWSSAEYYLRMGLTSGATYTSANGNIGFALANATSTSPGSVKFIIKKQRLYDLGARGSLVSDIYALAAANGNGQPYTGTPNDRCPSTGGASWTLQGDIPDLPMGILILTIPLIAIYIYLNKHMRG